MEVESTVQVSRGWAGQAVEDAEKDGPQILVRTQVLVLHMALWDN